jgi:hypothetical protein
MVVVWSNLPVARSVSVERYANWTPGYLAEVTTVVGLCDPWLASTVSTAVDWCTVDDPWPPDRTASATWIPRPPIG